MKICCSCKIEKSLKLFNKRSGSKKDGRQAVCKECNKKKSAARYQQDKPERIKKGKQRRNEMVGLVRDYKRGKKCSFCTEDCIYCLDFHHVKEKEKSIAQMAVGGFSWDRILLEISKCILVCSNCHRKIHAGILDISNLQSI